MKKDSSEFSAPLTNFLFRILLALPFAGYIASYLVYMLNYYFFYELGPNHLLWASLVGLTGAYQCLNMGLYGYVSDVTTAADRTMRLSVLNGVFSAAYVIGTTLGSLLYDRVGDYYVIFGVSAALGVAGLVWALLIPESVVSTPEQRAEHRLLDLGNVR